MSGFSGFCCNQSELLTYFKYWDIISPMIAWRPVTFEWTDNSVVALHVVSRQANEAPGQAPAGEKAGPGWVERPGVRKAWSTASTVLPYVMVAGLMVTGLALLLHYFHMHNEYTTDSYYYMILARSIKSGAGYTVRGRAYTLYPPAYPLMILLFSLVIKNMAVAAAYVSILGAVFTILFTYLIGEELFGKVAGLIGAALLTFQPAFLKWCCLPMAEGFFTFCFAGSVYFWLTGCTGGSRARRLIGAAAGGLALFTRVEGLLVFPLLALVLLLYWKEAKVSSWELPVEFGLFALPFAGFLLRNLVATGHLTKYTDVYSRHRNPITLGILGTRLKTYAWSAALDKVTVALFYLGALVALVRKWKAFLVLFGWVFLFIVFHLFWYWTYERYMVPAIPAMALFAGYLFQQAGELSYRALGLSGKGRGRRAARRQRRALGAALVCLFCLVLLLLSGAFAFTVAHEVTRGRAVIRLHSGELSDDYGGKALFKIADWLDDHVKKGQAVASDFGPDLNYAYSGKLYYIQPVPSGDPLEDSDLKPPGLLEKLSAAGVKYVVLGKETPPREVSLAVPPDVPPVFAVRMANIGFTQAEAYRLKMVALFVEKYGIPEPHTSETGIFAIQPR